MASRLREPRVLAFGHGLLGTWTAMLTPLETSELRESQLPESPSPVGIPDCPLTPLLQSFSLLSTAPNSSH